MTILNRARAWWNRTEPSTDIAIADPELDFNATDMEPMFIHAELIGLEGWRVVTDKRGLEMTDRVLVVKGISPYSTEPITVSIGLRGAALGVVAGHIASSWGVWMRDFFVADDHRMDEFYAQGGEGGNVV